MSESRVEYEEVKLNTNGEVELNTRREIEIGNGVTTTGGDHWARAELPQNIAQ